MISIYLASVSTCVSISYLPIYLSMYLFFYLGTYAHINLGLPIPIYRYIYLGTYLSISQVPIYLYTFVLSSARVSIVFFIILFFIAFFLSLFTSVLRAPDLGPLGVLIFSHLNISAVNIELIHSKHKS